MSLFAITPLGVGQPVGFRGLPEGEGLAAGETFSVDFNPKGYVLAADQISLELPDPLVVAKALKEEEINAEWERKSQAGIVVNSKPIFTTLTNNAKVSGVLLAVTRGEPWPGNDVPYIFMDSTKARLTEAQYSAILEEQVRHYIACDNVQDSLLDDVAVAATVSEVNAIDVPGAPWPATVN